MNKSNISDKTTAELAVRTRHKIMRRLMPFLICLFIVAFIDRVNLGFAKFEMTEDLGFNPEMIGFGGGDFDFADSSFGFRFRVQSLKQILNE